MIVLPQCYRELVYRWLCLELHRRFGGVVALEDETDYAAVMRQCQESGLSLLPVFCGGLIVFALMAEGLGGEERMVAALRTSRCTEEGNFLEDMMLHFAAQK